MLHRGVWLVLLVQLRLLAACCLSDILRIFAPQHPYDDKEIQVSDGHILAVH